MAHIEHDTNFTIISYPVANLHAGIGQSQVKPVVLEKSRWEYFRLNKELYEENLPKLNHDNVYIKMLFFLMPIIVCRYFQ
jgi:hypothetical protein